MNSRYDPWPSIKIQESKNSLKNLIDLIESWEDISKSSKFRSLDDRIQDSADVTKVLLGKLTIVRACGFLEIIIEDAIRNHASKGCHPGVKEYIETTLGKGRKANCERILEVAKFFCNATTIDELEVKFTENEKYHQGNINSLITYRNKIAHGLSEDVNPSKAIKLANTALEIGEYLIISLDGS